MEIVDIIVLCFGALMIGITKAGFGGGTGIVVTPLWVMILSPEEPKQVVGLMLPLLLITDVFAMFHYWGKWDRKNITNLVPGAIFGIVIGTFILDKIPELYFKKTVGALACLFAVLTLLRVRIIKAEARINFKRWHGFIAGTATGAASTLAHIGGLISSMYLLTQRLSNQAFVGTATALYFIINATKIPVYYKLGLFSKSGLILNLKLVPLIGVGVLLGIFLNMKVSNKLFSRIILTIVIIAGIRLLIG